jgi:hypothetical protein
MPSKTGLVNTLLVFLFIRLISRMCKSVLGANSDNDSVKQIELPLSDREKSLFLFISS